IMERSAQKALSAVEKRTQRIASGPITSVSTCEELTAAIEAKATNIYLLQDIYLDKALQIDYDVFFLADPQGKTIYAAAECRHIQITSSNVQIQFDNIILNGNYSINTKATISGGIDADNATDITIVGLNIQNCFSIAISNTLPDDTESSFSLYNCSFENNLSDCADSYSTNILLYNVICENNGGGFLLGTNAAYPYENAVISDISIYNTTIMNNKSSGIMLYNSNTFLDSNTLIEGNTSNFGGSGISAENSHIESYATIKNNVTTRHGGGILLYNSTATIQGGEISYNKANTTVLSDQNYGGGIAIETDTANPSGDVIINNGILEGNQAAYGGAIGSAQSASYDYSPSYVKINGGTIRENGNEEIYPVNFTKTCERGGGISAETVEITDGIIEKNLALIGAGVCAKNFIMSGGTIQDNGYFLNDNEEIIVQALGGGGVYAHETATITDGLIYSNMAKRGGGISINGTFNLSAPAYIRYNT
ncbi:MAG: right-handed parallel beta-helix repeat-containing protein, partial [Eubacterium sp.]|nr:right-handed parallel beta-helix repeat-containing protein [Eubacterium sp.]